MYEKQGFYSGQPLSASQLGAMEDGIINAEKLAMEAAAGAANMEKGTGASATQQLNTQAIGENSASFGGRLDLMKGTDAEHLDPVYSTEAQGKYSFAANASTRAYGYGASTFGENTEAYQVSSMAVNGASIAGLTEQEFNLKWKDLEVNAGIKVDKKGNILTEGAVIVDGEGWDYARSRSFAFSANELTKAKGRSSASFGNRAAANGDESFAGGYQSQANNMRSFAFGDKVTSSGINAVAFGYHNTASGQNAFVTGGNNNAYGSSSFVSGEHNTAADCAFATGDHSASNAKYAFASGEGTTANGLASTVFGKGSEARGDHSFVAGGIYNTAVGADCFVGGVNNSANDRSFVFGWDNNITGADCYVLGKGLKTTSNGRVIVGQYNNDTADVSRDGSIFTVANGASDGERSNAFEVYKDGDIGIYKDGKIYSLQKMLAAYFTDANLK
jgi:hypothetical protein